MVTVINMRDLRGRIWTHPDGKAAEPYVYIGRAGHGLPGTFGNPYVLRPGQDRGSTLTAYAMWFALALKQSATFKAQVDAIPSNAILVCFCKPLACHGDIMATYLNQR